MFLRKWDALPDYMKTQEVREYYEILSRKKAGLAAKRLFDIVAALLMLTVLAVPMLLIAAVIAADSPGGALYRQTRVTAYGKEFQIHKFRTMEANADQAGSLITVRHDRRITRVGSFLRKYHLDELPQLLDVLAGNMSYVGTRPEIPEYVRQYTNEMKVTLLLPAGITSEASILYKDEAELMDSSEDVDTIYIKQVLPGKMYYNLRYIRNFSFWRDIRLMFRTVFVIFGKEYKSEDEPEIRVGSVRK